jgi:hypothetical protein
MQNEPRFGRAISAVAAAVVSGARDRPADHNLGSCVTAELHPCLCREARWITADLASPKSV